MVKRTKKRRSTTRKKSPQLRKRQNPFWQEFLRKRLIPLSVLFCLAITATWFFISGTYDHLKQKSWDTFIEKSIAHGFIIEDIQVVGRKRVAGETLLALLNANQGDPIFNFKPLEAQANLEQLSWIKTAHVERRLPDVLLVKITEREPVALWQNKEQFSLIDMDGEILTDQNLGAYNHLPILIGSNANEHATNILPLLYSEEIIAQHTNAITRIGDRRWDLTLKNNMMVKLPEKDIGLALSRLAQMNEQDQVLSRDIEIIDLRLADKAIIRPSAKANLTIERPNFDEADKPSKKNI